MAGLRPETPIPVEIKLRQKSRQLEINFDNSSRFELSFEFLRVFSPSAETRGHGVGQEKLQIGKRGIDILRIEPVGNYAIRPVFSDGHESGLYSWDVLYDLCVRRDELWRTYRAYPSLTYWVNPLHAGMSRHGFQCSTSLFLEPGQPLTEQASDRCQDSQ